MDASKTDHLSEAEIAMLSERHRRSFRDLASSQIVATKGGVYVAVEDDVFRPMKFEPAQQG